MYNCCCKRLNENRDKLYFFLTWCNLLDDKVDPMYLFSADFHAAARADLFIFFSLPAGSTCASSEKILAAEPPTRKKGSLFLPRWRIRCQNFPRGYFRLPLSISRQMSLELGVVVQNETRITTFCYQNSIRVTILWSYIDDILSQTNLMKPTEKMWNCLETYPTDIQSRTRLARCGSIAISKS